MGVFRALDSAGIRPDLIVGTSIGAITGALYASGYTGDQIDSLTRALPLARVIHAYEPRLPGVLGDVPAVAVLERRNGRMRLQTGAVQESEINALMSAMMLRGNLAAAGDFDRLPIPFRAVATNIDDGQSVVLGRGDLARAVRASFAIPVVFQPVRIEARLLNDGGMANNVPVTIARALGAERVIVSTLPSAPVNASELDSPFGVAVKLVDALVRNELLPLGPDDVLVRHDTESFDLLDFGPAQSTALIRQGYASAQKALAQARCVRTLGQTVQQDAARTVTLARVAPLDTLIRGGAALLRTLGLSGGRRIFVDSLRERLLAVGESGRYQGMWLYPTPATEGALALDPVPLAAPTLSVGLGASFDGDNGGRVSVSGAMPMLLGGRLDAGADLRAGRYRQEARVVMQSVPGDFTRALTFPVELRAAHENVRRFISDGEQPSVPTGEVSAFGGVAGARGPFRWFAGPMAVAWYSDSARTWQRSGGARIRVATPRRAMTRLELIAEATGSFYGAWLDAAYGWTRGPLTLRPFVRAGAGDRLPLQRTFLLGGANGFPGLRIGEGRADRTAMIGTTAQLALFGPLAAEVEVAGGALGARRDPTQGPVVGGALPNEVLLGARFGVRLDTPAGPIQVAEGVNSRGEHVLYLRIGRWY